MKWLKIETNILGNAKINKLTRHFGPTGFSIYIAILTFIGSNIKPNVDEKEFGYLPSYIELEDIYTTLHIEKDEFEKILDFIIIKLELFDKEKYEKNKIIYCSSILEYADEYSKRWVNKELKTTDKLRTNYRQTTKKNRATPKSIHSEEEVESESESEIRDNICPEKKSGLLKSTKPAKSTKIAKPTKSTISQLSPKEKSKYTQATDYWCSKYLEAYGVKYIDKQVDYINFHKTVWKKALSEDLELWKKIVDYCLKGDFYANKNGGITLGIISANINQIIPAVNGSCEKLKNSKTDVQFCWDDFDMSKYQTTPFENKNEN